jgi:hypothetical protein
MNTKVKSRPLAVGGALRSVRPPMAHDAPNGAAASPAARGPAVATQRAIGAANHARHHVSRQTQA